MPRDPVTITLVVILAVTMLAWLLVHLIRALARREINAALKGFVVAGVLRPVRDKRGRFKRV